MYKGVLGRGEGGSKNACAYNSFGNDGLVLLYIGSGLLEDGGNYLLDIRFNMPNKELCTYNVLTKDSQRRWLK